MSVRTRYLGTTLALLAAGLVYVATQAPARPRPAPPPARGAVTVALPLTAVEVVAAAEWLQLTPEQRRRLEALAEEWREDAVRLEAEAGEANEAFGRFAEEARAAGRTSLEEIGRWSEEVRQRSLALRALREFHAARVLATLNERQRARLYEVRGTTTGGLR